jgi:hypothetical protein
LSATFRDNPVIRVPELRRQRPVDMKQLLAASMCGVIGASTVMAGGAAPGATQYVALGEYYSTVYTAAPQGHAEYVWWRTEPLILRVSVTNEGRDPIVLRMPKSARPFVVSIAPVEGRSQQTAKVNWSSLVTRSASLAERPATLPAMVESASSLRWSGVTSDVSSLRPGIYRLMVRSELDLGGAALQVNNDSVRIDLRDVATDTDRLELLRIRATRCLSERQFACVDSFADQMAKIYPQAAIAFWLKGQSATGRGNNSSARRHYSKSVELLNSKADRIFTTLNGEHRSSEFIAGIEARLKNLR